MEKLRSWIWHRLVFLADRISPEDAFRCTGYSMRLRKGHGWVFEPHDGRNGVKLWYKGDRSYKEHSHDGYGEETLVTNTWFSGETGLTDEEVERAAKNALRWSLTNR
jgi:hypothetical protein